MTNHWISAIMGIVVGDALGCPVQFLSRNEIASRPNGPVTDMEGWGTFNLPKGSWTDDSSLTLATLNSIIIRNSIDLTDIMRRFTDWLNNGRYTPYGYAYDIGGACLSAIKKYKYVKDPLKCGKKGEHANGNGSLMRIMPAVLYTYIMQKRISLSDADAIGIIHNVAALTHNHTRAKMACGIYFFITRSILDRFEETSLLSCVQAGIDTAMNFYNENPEVMYYARLRNAAAFSSEPVERIKSTGYVVDSLEAAIWSLLTTDSFSECLLTAVNLGDDTDSIAAIAGGLAGIFYGYDTIPKAWLNTIVNLDWIENLCTKADNMFF